MTKILLVILYAIVLTLPQVAFAGNVSKAKDFMKAMMYPQATALLEKEINNNPTNAEAHFQLAVCYINKGDIGNADARFVSAVALKPDYGYEIGKAWRTAGTQALSKNNVSSVDMLFSKAIEYQPSLKKGIADELYAKGKTSFQGGSYRTADSYFSLALKFGYSGAKEIAGFFFDKATQLSSIESIPLFMRAANYDNNLKGEIGERLASMTKDGKYSEKERDSFKHEAGKYLTDAQMTEHFPPDFKIYQPGTYTFNLKAGETTDHWIQIAHGLNYYSVDSVDHKFILKFFDGEIVKGWLPGYLPAKYKFKIENTSNSPISLIVK